MKKLERCEKFGRRLVDVREKYGKKAREIADMLEVTPVTLNRFEKSERTPDVMQAKTLADKLPVNLHWLITGRGEMTFREKDTKSTPLFEVIHNKYTGDKIIVPGGEKAEQVYKVEGMFMAPRICEGDYVFIDRDQPSEGDLVAFRDDTYRVRAGWLRKVRGEKGRFLVAEMPSEERYAEKVCEILGRVICSVKVDQYR